ncbi:MAG: hypothetical protein K0R81_1508 [Microbacterium sp.]|nr:hypothetical protein [Microbacterium sp.]
MSQVPSSRRDVTDWLFVAWIAGTVLVSFAFVGAPLIVAASSLLTRLRTEKRKQITLWIVAAVLSILTLLPFLVIWFGGAGSSFSDHPVAP